MDEVAENSDELMERYLEGEEISHDEIVTALKKGVTEGHLFPVTCGIATKNLGTSRLLEAIVEDVPSPAMRGRDRGARRGRRGGRGRARPGRRPGRLRVQDHRRPLHRPDQPAARLLRRPALRLAGRERDPQREGADRPAGRPARQGARARSTRSAPATSARWPSCARPARATCSRAKGAEVRSRPSSCRRR